MPRKSDFSHWLSGSVSQARPDPDFEPEAGRPAYPNNISKTAKQAFKRLVEILQKRRAVTPGDFDVLRIYAVTFDRHEPLEHLQAEGEVVETICLDNHGEQFVKVKHNLWLRVAQDSEKSIIQCLDRLGLTPLAKSKVKPAKSKEAPIDPMEKFMTQPREVYPAPAYDDSAPMVCGPGVDEEGEENASNQF
jgi:P27 family predicted phage terminase small subunit